jgi:hypothetical protein
MQVLQATAVLVGVRERSYIAKKLVCRSRGLLVKTFEKAQGYL